MNRWPYTEEPNFDANEEPQPVFDRLVKDTDKRLKNNERESTMQFTYRENVVVKKDIYIEYDFKKTLHTDAPGDKQERLRQFSPSMRRKEEE